MRPFVCRLAVSVAGLAFVACVNHRPGTRPSKAYSVELRGNVTANLTNDSATAKSAVLSGLDIVGERNSGVLTTLTKVTVGVFPDKVTLTIERTFREWCAQGADEDGQTTGQTFNVVTKTSGGATIASFVMGAPQLGDKNAVSFALQPSSARPQDFDNAVSISLSIGGWPWVECR